MDASSLPDLAIVGDIETGITIPEETAATLAKKKAKPTRKLFPKPPKPPRPHPAPCLDAADRRLIQELSEITTLKQARLERIKASRKTKNSSPPPSNYSSVCALLVTVFFCLVIVWEAATTA